MKPILFPDAKAFLQPSGQISIPRSSRSPQKAVKSARQWQMHEILGNVEIVVVRVRQLKRGHIAWQLEVGDLIALRRLIAATFTLNPRLSQ